LQSYVEKLAEKSNKVKKELLKVMALTWQQPASERRRTAPTQTEVLP
jgi:hypothetical protein